jgi:hypothetical protein
MTARAFVPWDESEARALERMLIHAPFDVVSI